MIDHSSEIRNVALLFGYTMMRRKAIYMEKEREVTHREKREAIYGKKEREVTHAEKKESDILEYRERGHACVEKAKAIYMKKESEVTHAEKKGRDMWVKRAGGHYIWKYIWIYDFSLIKKPAEAGFY